MDLNKSHRQKFPFSIRLGCGIHIRRMKIIVMTSRGLEDALFDELKDLGIANPLKGRGYMVFDGTWKDCFHVNLNSRIATRVLWNILNFRAKNPVELYNQIKAHDFTQYINPDQALAVETHSRSDLFTDSRFVSLKTKDAIVDQFREKFEIRPDVDKKNPDLHLFIRVTDTEFEVSINTSGDSLFKRGYRVETVFAPMKEHLAAGLIRYSGWNREIPIVDPMCGSGTILIEAALQKLNIPPGSGRKKFGFEKLKTFDRSLWEEVTGNSMKEELSEIPFKFYGYDIDRKAILAAKVNAEEAGLGEHIFFKRLAIQELEPPTEHGMLILNPPYGERLDNDENLRDVYRDLGYVLKNRFKGWTCWVMSGHQELATYIGLKSSRKIPVWNGPIECRFLKYEVHSV